MIAKIRRLGRYCTGKSDAPGGNLPAKNVMLPLRETKLRTESRAGAGYKLRHNGQDQRQQNSWVALPRCAATASLFERAFHLPLFRAARNNNNARQNLKDHPTSQPSRGARWLDATGLSAQNNTTTMGYSRRLNTES